MAKRIANKVPSRSRIIRELYDINKYEECMATIGLIASFWQLLVKLDSALEEEQIKHGEKARTKEQIKADAERAVEMLQAELTKLTEEFLATRTENKAFPLDRVVGDLFVDAAREGRLDKDILIRVALEQQAIADAEYSEEIGWDKDKLKPRLVPHGRTLQWSEYHIGEKQAGHLPRFPVFGKDDHEDYDPMMRSGRFPTFAPKKYRRTIKGEEVWIPNVRMMMDEVQGYKMPLNLPMSWDVDEKGNKIRDTDWEPLQVIKTAEIDLEETMFSNEHGENVCKIVEVHEYRDRYGNITEECHMLEFEEEFKTYDEMKALIERYLSPVEKERPEVKFTPGKKKIVSYGVPCPERTKDDKNRVDIVMSAQFRNSPHYEKLKRRERLHNRYVTVVPGVRKKGTWHNGVFKQEKKEIEYVARGGIDFKGSKEVGAPYEINGNIVTYYGYNDTAEYNIVGIWAELARKRFLNDLEHGKVKICRAISYKDGQKKTKWQAYRVYNYAVNNKALGTKTKCNVLLFCDLNNKFSSRDLAKGGFDVTDVLKNTFGIWSHKDHEKWIEERGFSTDPYTFYPTIDSTNLEK